MKKSIIILGCSFILSSVSFGQVTKVLFLGNSYTGAHNLPEKVYQLASSMGDSVYFDSNTPGGFRLLNHATDPVTLAKISQENWDFVLIQAQSQEPSWPPSQVATEVLPYASILNDSIKSNFPCTETVFYMTWGRKYGDQQNCATWPPVCTFLGMQERLMTGYMSMAEQNASTVAPIGLSWKHAMDNDPDSLINLYSSDNSHPSLSGTYLTACVIYASMFHRSPVGSVYSAGLPESTALYLQQMAREVVLGEDYSFTFFDTYTNINYDLDWKSWFEYGNISIAGFDFSGSDLTYSFFDNSLNAETWIWDFGDGTTSILQNPMHTYAEGGYYLVSQSTGNLCFDDMVYDTLNVLLSASEKMKVSDRISISPNPGNGVFNVVITAPGQTYNIRYEVISSTGKLVEKGKIGRLNGIFSRQIDLSKLYSGYYNLRIYLENVIISQTLILSK